MSGLVETIWVKAQVGNEYVAFGPGDTVPEWAADQMGDHCFEDGVRPEFTHSAASGVAPKTGYDALTIPKLKAEIAERNEGRADNARISGEGNKGVLIAALEVDDAVQAKNYSALTDETLVELIEARNTGREDDDLIAADGPTADLVAALELDDESQAGSGQTEQ